eukprot:465139-Rhodomonas_salina.1
MGIPDNRRHAPPPRPFPLFVPREGPRTQRANILYRNANQIVPQQECQMGKNVSSSVSNLYPDANEIVPKCKWNDNVKLVKLFYPQPTHCPGKTPSGLRCCTRIYKSVRIVTGWGYSGRNFTI